MQVILLANRQQGHEYRDVEDGVTRDAYGYNKGKEYIKIIPEYSGIIF